jgi:hypothetical protein
MSNKKHRERSYLDEARAASFVFPGGEPEPHDPLDFLFPRESGGKLGIEVTELCRQDERKEGADLGHVAREAKRLYDRRPDATPIDVSLAFSPDAHEFGVAVLASGLAEFVYEHRNDHRAFDWSRRGEVLPKGYCYIALFAPRGSEKWQSTTAFQAVGAPKELLDATIAKKNARLPLYRTVAAEVWLLLINDQFLGAGEVHVSLDDLARWTFLFEFDRVFLFWRQPGGSGEVVELQRAPR